TQLITAQGLRGQVLRERGSSGGLLNSAINALIDSHLVRGEPLRGAIWYELTHDRLIGPIQADNVDWRTAHLSQLQQQAALWERQERPDGLLLRDAALTQAEQWADEHRSELTDVEHSFLARCREVCAAIERERRKNQIIQGLAIVSTVVGVVALLLAVFAFDAKRKADSQASRAKAQALASRALTDSLTRPQLSLLLALEAQRIGSPDGLFQGEEALQQLLTRLGGRPTTLPLSPDLVAFSADGAWLAISGASRATSNAAAQLVLQSTADPAQAISLVVPDNTSLSKLALSADGALLAGTTQTGNLLLWRSASPQELPQVLDSDVGNAAPVVFSQNGSLLIGGDGRGQALIWQTDNVTATPQAVKCLSQIPTALAISPDNTKLIFGYRTGQVQRKLINDPSSPCIDEFAHQHEEQVMVITFSPDGTLLASGSSDSEVLVSLLVGASSINAFHNHNSAITGLQFSPDNKRIISSSRDGTAQIWGIFAADKTALILRGHEGWVLGASFSQNGAEALTVGRDSALRSWNATHPAVTHVIQQHTREIAAVAYSPDGHWLAIGSIDKKASLWAVEGDDVRYIATLSATSSIWMLAFSSDSSLLATASEDGKVRIWDVTAPQSALASITVHSGWTVTGVAFSPDRRYLAAVGLDGDLRLWDISQPARPLPYKEWSSPDPLHAVAFDDAGHLAVAGDSGVVTLWSSVELRGSPEVLGAGAGYGPIYALAFRPKHPGQLAAAGFAAKIWIWDLAEPGHQPRSLSGHTDWIIGMAFSSDGNQLATASNDDTVRIWQPDLNENTVRSSQIDWDGSSSLVLRGHSADVDTVSFSPDGRWLASGSLDSKVIIWPLDLAMIQTRACTTTGRGFTSAEIGSFNLPDKPALCTAP
ncbi:MAG: WD40 repeat domain-containing protein, partial [Oscillochloris sp.]|nr:WD40 repeat domain-containing protein [Oscillochloris sp.]